MHRAGPGAKVTARRVGEEMIELLALGAVALMSGWRSVWRPAGEPRHRSMYNAMRRLERQGVVVRRMGGARDPVLELAPAAESTIDPIVRPERRWSATWSGRWYLFSYDVPESRRGSRNTLREFLKRLRLGQLHQSLWITPFDIRPEYDDLCRGASIADVGRLFEAHTVFDARPADIVFDAWPWAKIEAAQNAYLEHAAKIGTPANTADAAWEDIVLYREAMKLDPLLPRDLWPRGYAGERCWRAHREIQKRLRPSLFSVAPAESRKNRHTRFSGRPSKKTGHPERR